MNWISVKDRLPKEKQTVLCWYKFKQLPYDTNIGVTKYRGEFSKLITHWRPLPEPPEDV